MEKEMSIFKLWETTGKRKEDHVSTSQYEPER